MLIRFAFIAVISIGTISEYCHAQGKDNKKVKVYGTVVDSKGKPKVGVIVSLYPSGKGDAVITKKTDKEGKYDFGVIDVASAYDLLYIHSTIDPAVISRLSESNEQQIHTVVYGRREVRPPSEVITAINAVEKLFVFMSSDDDKLKADAHTEILKNWNETKSFEILEEKVFAITPINTSRGVHKYIEGRQESLKKALSNGDLKSKP